MVRTFKQAIQLVLFNKMAIFGFEIIYKFVGVILVSPILFLLFRFSIKISGFNYLTFDNVVQYLVHPATLLTLLVSLLSFMCFLYIEMITLFDALEYSKRELKVTAIELISISFRHCVDIRKKLSIKNIGLMIVILPLMQILMGLSYFPDIRIPSFIVTFIMEKIELVFLIASLGYLAVYLAIRLMHSIPLFIFKEISLREAISISLKFTKRKFIKNVIVILLWNMVMVLPLIWLQYFVQNKVMSMQSAINIPSFFEMIIPFLLLFIPLFISMYLTPIKVCILSTKYDELGEKSESTFERLDKKRHNFFRNNKGHLTYFFIIPLLVLSGIGINTLTDTFYRMSLLRNIEITAHRGDSQVAIENTLPAFLFAIDTGADVIELDVMKTKDNVLVVFHDKNLKRMASINKNIEDLTYDELALIQVYDPIPKWAPPYANIPTLEEVLNECQGKIKFNIEIKSEGEDVVERVVNEIVNRNLIDDTVVTSLNYTTVQSVKNYNPKIKTGYITSVAYGEVSRLEAADIISVEASFITKALIKEIHQSGKLVYAWTVNDPKEIKKLIELGVDNVITDNVYEAVSIRNQKKLLWIRI